MALTPQNNDAFFREVDEDLRRDRMVGLARAWGPIAIGAIVVLLLALAAGLWWRGHRAHAAGVAGETLSTALTPLENGRPAPDPTALARVAASPRDGYQAMARLALAASVAAKGDAVAAAATYDAVAGDGGLPQPVRDLALLRATALRFDTLAPAAVIDRLKGLAVTGNAFFPSAAELTGLAWLKLGRKDKAGPLFAALAQSPDTPGSLRGRAAGLATSLGRSVKPLGPRPS